MASEDDLAATAGFLRSVPGIGPVAITIMIAEMPEFGQLSGEQATVLAGSAPIAHDSGAMRALEEGRRQPRRVMFQVALVASYHNPILKTSADRLRAAGKPHKFVIKAVAHKLDTIANALCKSGLTWTTQTA